MRKDWNIETISCIPLFSTLLSGAFNIIFITLLFKHHMVNTFMLHVRVLIMP